MQIFQYALYFFALLLITNFVYFLIYFLYFNRSIFDVGTYDVLLSACVWTTFGKQGGVRGYIARAHGLRTAFAGVVGGGVLRTASIYMKRAR